MRFTEGELTTAMTGVAKAALAAQSKEIRKGKVDLEQAWIDLGGYGRYQLLESLGSQILPILVALPDMPRTPGERPKFSNAEVRAAVEANTGEIDGRIKRKALVMTRVALVQTALAHVPPWTDPDSVDVPDSLA